MKKLWLLIRYYYFWQPVIPLVVGIGVFLFVLKITFTNTSAGVTFALGMASFTFLFIIPFFSGATALRHLIANSQTSMVPGFRLFAAIAHLVIAIAASIFLYVNFLVFAPDDYSPLVMLQTFMVLSAYAGFMQLILPNRYFVTIISLAPVVFVMILFQFRELLAPLFLDPAFTIALFLVTLAGWGYGFRVIAKGGRFRPANTSLDNTEDWSSYDGGKLNRMAIGQSRTAEGTLLLGYPDNWWSIVLRVVYFSIITPIFTTAAMFIIGVTEEWDTPLFEGLLMLFLMLSLFSGMYCIFIYGELVPRARLLWLRYGTDRHDQWQLVDYYCQRFLMLYYLSGSVIALLACLFTNIPGIYLLHYLLLLFSFCCFNIYFSLLVRASRLPSLVLCLVVAASLGLLITGFYYALWADATSFAPLIVIEILFAALGLSCRQQVKQLFTGIDWRLVSIKRTPGKMVLTQE